METPAGTPHPTLIFGERGNEHTDKTKFEILPSIIHPSLHEIRRNPPQKKYFRRRKIPLLFTCIHMEFISSWYNIVIKCLPCGKTLKGITYE